MGSIFRAAALLFVAANIAGAASTVNVAAGKLASQSSTYNSSYAATNGVNGNFTDFTHTTAGVSTPATWEVNLGNAYAIERVVVWNRTSCCGSRLRDITVRILDVSGTVTNYTSALLNPENALGSPATLSIDLVALTGAPVIGGRVRVTRTPDPDLSGSGGAGDGNEADVLSMAEVEVFGTQLTGAIPPTVSLATPGNGESFYSPAAIYLSANASDLDGSVLRVDFLQGTELVGTANGPFSTTAGPFFEGTYSFRAVAMDNSGVFATSAPVSITVIDTNPPVMLSATASTNSVTVTFSKRVATGSTNPLNYAISSGVTVLGATYGVTSNMVVLSTTPLDGGSNYTLVVNEVQDISGQVIATNSALVFNLLNFVSSDVGGPVIRGSVILTPGGYDITSAGRDIAGTTDQFQFECRPYTNDFDVAVRLESLGFVDAWSKAGLMARETLGASSRFAASFATPSASGCFFSFRDLPGAANSMSGSFPAAYPNLWLRLKRIGSTFSGYASVDANAWALLGSATVSMSNVVQVGMAVSSRATNQPVTAQFRQFGNVTSNISAVSVTLPHEPIGQSSRRTMLAFTEIMYHPREIPGFTNSAEFIELYNSGYIDDNLGGYRISGDVDFAFPANTVLKAGAMLVIARDPAFVRSYYGITNVIGPYTNNLPGSGMVRLRNRAGAVLLEVPYQGANPWPIAADGTGHSLVLARPTYGEANAAAWAASDSIDGSPGRPEPFSAEPLRNVVINELLANSDPPLEDFVELYNHGTVSVNLSGTWLSDDAATNKFRIPDGTHIPAGGFVSFTQTQLGFGLSASGERVFLVNSNQTRVVDAVTFDAQSSGVSFGRWPDGAGAFYPLASRSAATNNSAPWQSDIVINEIMFNPITGNSDEEYIELHNRGTSSVSLARWRLTDGISYTFPTNVTIAAGGYVVVARNVTNLVARYPGQLTTANTFGGYSGSLANNGERIALVRAEIQVSTNAQGVLTTNTIYPVVNEVTYGPGGRWGAWSDGGGSSLELIDPNTDNRLAANWADSDESAKGQWITIQNTFAFGEVLTNATVPTANDHLQVFLLGVGECLVDDVEVINAADTSVNLIGANNGFESDLSGWTLQGSHDQSTIENTGYAGAKALHLRAASRGDNGANKVRSPTFSALATSPATIRCKARWLRGWPELLLRLHGGTLEAAGRLAVPTNLGTPGARNSRFVNNAPPAVFNVQHAPILPLTNDPVVVTAQVSDPNGIASITLQYRIDPGSNFVAVAMNDNGTGGDAIAGDGVYSAAIPGQGAGVLAAFYVEATDNAGALGRFPSFVFASDAPRAFPNDSPSRECLVRWGEVQMPGNFSTYHVWTSSASSNRWHTRDNLNNAPIDATVVYNNSRVIYNAGALYSGSPFHRGQMTTGPAGQNRCDYIVQVPDDDRLLGSADINLALPGNANGATTTHDLSSQGEQTAYLLFDGLGLPHYLRRYVHVFVNGSQRSTVSSFSGSFIYEDAQQPNGDVIRMWFPDDSEGDLTKVEDWFEFDNAATAFVNNDGDLTRREISYNGSNILNLAAYRFMWRKRSLSSGQSALDYTNFFKLLNAVSPTTTNNAPLDVAKFNQVADVEQWMREFACQHTVGNFDSYGYDRGKNSYTYRRGDGRVVMLPWDIDWVLGTGSGRGTNDSLFLSSDPRMVAAYGTPEIRRAYLRAFKDLIDGPLNNAFIDPIMDAKAAAFTLNNVNYSPSTLAAIKLYVLNRRAYIQGQLAGLTNGFSINPPTPTSPTNVITLTGTAPVDVKDIAINGVIYPVIWGSGYTNWSVRVGLSAGNNEIMVQGLNRNGEVVSGTSTTNMVSYVGATLDPVTSVVISEIQFAGPIARSEYVELFNTSSNTAFDLSGWRFNGLSYTFGGAALLPPRSYMVLARDLEAFATAYGTNATPFGVFDGELQNDGETLTLIRPGRTPAEDVAVNKVRYESVVPWPSPAGASLQVIDPMQDNSRVGNWTSSLRPAKTNDGWRFVSVTGNMSFNNRLVIYLDNAGSVILDDIWLVTGTNAATGSNFIKNGDFEAPLGSSWTLGVNMPEAGIISSVTHSGAGALLLAQTNAGNASSLSRDLVQLISPAPTAGQVCTLSFWYWATNNTATNLSARILSSSGLSANPDIRVFVTPGTNFYTPGGPSYGAATLPTFPTLWVNEVQAENISGIADAAGERDPWVEIYNAGTNAVSLDGLYLASTYTNLLAWQIPTGITVPARGFRTIWCDGQTGQTNTGELHAGFRLPAIAGSVAPSRLVNGSTQIVDYINYNGLHPNRSFGSFPDGQPFNRQEFFHVTPGATNNGSSGPLTVFINEWMADNVTALADPADDGFEDWFELYNPSTNQVDLAGYYLTDALTNKFKYRITTNGPHVIPGRGYLLVWADNETGQNTTANGSARPDLHVNFQLSAGGEAIGLFAADGTQIDAVTFGSQTNDISQGRFPDGNPNVVFMPGTASPRAANHLGGPANTAPLMPPIAGKTLFAGQTLGFNIAASDNDLPAQVLTFSLDNGPAQVELSGSGWFSWTPAAAGSYVVTVRVTDTGVPPLSTTQTFSIEVLPTPRIATAGRRGSNMELAWQAHPGQAYRVEYKDDLSAPTWTLLETIVAGENTLSVTNDTGAATQRFYRVIAEP